MNNAVNYEHTNSPSKYIFFDIDPEKQFLDHMIIPFLFFWVISVMFSIVDVLIHLLPTLYKDSLFSLLFLTLIIFWICKSNHFDGVRKYHIMVLLCFSLMINHVELFFMCLLTECMHLRMSLCRACLLTN